MRIKKEKVTAMILAGMLVLSPQAALAEESSTFYEAMAPFYQYDDSASPAAPEGMTNRFVKKDGVYVNPDAEKTNRATLMITGDLMCQYRQQEAVFVSDGSDYITYEEHLEQRFAQEDAQKAAVEEALGNPQVSSGQLGAVAALTVPKVDYGVIPQPAGTWDFTQSFRYVKEILQGGDLVIGNLETMVSHSSPLAMQVHTLEGSPYLNAPFAYLDALKDAGFDMLTLSNNHNADTGIRGIYETLDNLDAYHFLHTGLFRDSEEDRYILVNVNGIKIGMVAYSSFFNNKDHNLSEEAQDVLLNRYALAKVRRDIKSAKAAGAEYIICFMHWGVENTHETSALQERYAYNVARAGADYIVGSHPHAIQRYDIIDAPDDRQVPVIYSMGNFVSHMKYDVNNDTFILQLNLKKDEKGAVYLAGQRLHPATVLTDMKTDGRIDSYIVVPQDADHRGLISGSSTEVREDLAYMDASLKRFETVFENRCYLPLPYDPYGLENSPLLSLGGAADRILRFANSYY